MSIYVGNLSYDVTEDDLNSVFAEYGSVKRVYVPTDRESGRMRGCAFVEMNSVTEEDKAIEPHIKAVWPFCGLTSLQINPNYIILFS